MRIRSQSPENELQSDFPASQVINMGASFVYMLKNGVFCHNFPAKKVPINTLLWIYLKLITQNKT